MTQPEPTEQSLTDPVFLTELRLQMNKFATLQLQDQSLAEDAVQEALLAALKSAHAFNRRSALKTWVFAILKNKISDLLRKNQRYVSTDKLKDGEETSDDALYDTLFNQRGFWHPHERPAKWNQPDADMENSHFWQVFDACLNGMPDKYGRLFMMREFLELTTDEICSNEMISVNSLNVTLYRARLRLRECLENRWFQKEAL
ncbi:RNA polymerase sigma-70 factor (TIGR02943 family) [Marinobacterium sp. MBR-111]|jgi:RNA polymerase sigma-70 factor (ECF subfamily)|uniref:RNA polymerase factor sigma-70 n=1 Tax=Marinobacterium sp. MBR-111 TaxID=3156463 RepID=UPI0033956AC3